MSHGWNEYDLLTTELGERLSIHGPHFFDLKARELGWDSYDDACQQIADRFGFATIEDLENEIECGPGGVDYEAQMTDEEYEMWTFDS
jgi:hypothetical protein